MTNIYRLLSISEEDATRDWIGATHWVATLQPTLYRNKARTQHKKGIADIITLAKLQTEYTYAIAELTEKSNVHYHIVSKFDPSIPYARDMMTDLVKNGKILGSVYINKHIIKDKEDAHRVFKYITEEAEKTYHIINFRREILDIDYLFKKKNL